MIQATRLSKSYGDEHQKVVALDAIDLAVEQGERVALVGRSGSGKTTLLNLLAGLDRPTGGELEVAGCSLASMNSQQLADYRLVQVGVVFQSFQLIAQRSALQNVELPLILAGTNRTERRLKATEALDRVGLAGRMNHRPWEMSGGEQQRVAVARAIVNRPQIVLADEPTGNLDTRTADEVTRLLMEVIAEQNATLVLITHDSNLAEQCAQRVIAMTDGKLVDDRPTQPIDREVSP